MRVPLKWLRDYIDIDVNSTEFADMMTLTGTKSEKVETHGEEINNVVVGKIESIAQHVNADKLVVCQVNVGTQIVQIVTGARNLSEGDFIPVALDGASLPGGVKIKNGSLRGVESCGMLCSGQELGIDEKFIPENSKEGILILDVECELGQDIKDVLLLNDATIEFEITANRPDCLSIMGIAYEAGATLGKKIKLKDSILKECDKGIEHKAEVVDSELCKRYILREIVDVKIGESPYYIKRRLIEAGIRPISNIVDITNYIMLEYGQPLHAFDRSDLDTDKIIVRRALDKEKFTTLDDVERELDSSMLMITDGEKSVGIAGVMGGLNSEIKETTTHVVLESAVFSADSIRSTSKKLGLRTDASSRYEKGIDIERADLAIQRACAMIEELGIGTVLKGRVDINNEGKDKKTLTFLPARIRTLIGEDISNETIINILKSLEFEVIEENDLMHLKSPSFRMDINIEADVVEEIARIYGYNRIVSKPIIGEIIPGLKSSKRIFEDKVKDASMKNGLTEIATYSFVSPKGVVKANLKEDKYTDFLNLLNPLGEETSVMRTSLIPNMLDVIYTNSSRKNEEFYGFELGNTFSKGEGAVPVETMGFVAASYGKKEDFFTLKSRIEGILQSIGIKNATYVPFKESETFHPGKTAKIMVRGRVELGIIGEVHPTVLENFGIKKKVVLCEINMPNLMEVSNEKIKYQSIPRHPGITRDIALIVDQDQYISSIEEVIKKNGKKLIESIELFDVYTGNQVPKGKKSVAYSIKYQAGDRSLVDEEVNEIQNKILKELEEKFNIVLR